MTDQGSVDEVWEVDKFHFKSVDKTSFMDRVRDFPIMCDTGKARYKEKKTTRQNALRQIAKNFKGTAEMVETRCVL